MSLSSQSLAYSAASEMVFGRAPRPVECGFGLRIGEGTVFPEVNFTLPSLTIDQESWSEVVGHYSTIADSVVRRATALKAPGIVLEFELLPAMTENPEWGAEIVRLLKTRLAEAHARTGLKSALRVTPVDVRDRCKPPVLRSGEAWEVLKRSFELCIEAGADIVSIESVGGKELHDQGLMYGDIRTIVFALGLLAPLDVAWLWDEISEMCRRSGTAVAGGDTACGFANTAMQLAGQKLLPEVLAAVVRAMSAVRTLVAFEHGAIGPSKDCAYEGPIIKAITGCPISMEGKSACCAHFSPVGNIAAAMCDLWSNESVQNVRLLSGDAPEAFTELLIYDCRLFNTALRHGREKEFREWLIESDEWLSPQAAVLSPRATWEIAAAIVNAPNDYRRVVGAGRAAVRLLWEGLQSNNLRLSTKEQEWLTKIEAELCSLPAEGWDLLPEMLDQHANLFDLSSYGCEGLPQTRNVAGRL